MQQEITREYENTFVPMIIIGVLFFVFGFATWLNGALIPFLKIVCELDEFQALFVTFSFYIAYTIMAMPAAIVLKKSGYKNGMVIGLAIMALGAMTFVPAAKLQSYAIFLLGLFILGSGLTLLQTAANPYIVCVGPRESAAMRISIMGVINKAAGVVVPIVFTAMILSGMDQFEESVLASLSELERNNRLAELSQRLVLPYNYLAACLVVLALYVKFSSLKELNFEKEEKVEENHSLGVLKFPHTVLGSIALFAYVGVEVIAGDTIGLYGQGLGVRHFGSLTSYTMAFMVIGYLAGIACIPRFISQQQALMGTSLIGIVFALGVLMASSDSTAIADVMIGWMGIPVVPDTVMFVSLLGFANAMVWPAVWPLSLEGLGKYTASGSALLIMGIAGGAIIPLIYGHFAEGGQAKSAYWVLLPCYLYILFYSLKGYKIKQWR